MRVIIQNISGFLVPWILSVTAVNICIGFTYFILGEFHLLDTYPFLGFIVWYVLMPLTLLLYFILILFLGKKKEYKMIERKIIELFQLTVISFFVFLVLVRIEFIHPLLGYAYVYAIFPCVLFLYICSILVFIRKKEVEILKKSFFHFLLWFFILLIGVFTANLFDGINM